ncbi:PAS domain-containing protein [Rhizobium terrae]|uniref:PAS domain-containing protein n=1 Tax=Rhizobium terrae TaxID=2171756 RepID=UPI000E3C1FF5|nr:PAS domain-containing protein [Rhizobium terrae]
MRNQASRAIFDYWINIKGDHAAPLRTEIDPTALRHLLPHLFIIANDTQGVLAFRLAGTRICDLFNREFRSAPFATVWTDGDQHRPAEIARHVILYEKPALLDVLASNGDTQHPYEMLLMPVRSTEVDACDRVLGALLPCEERFSATHRPLVGLALEDWTFLTGAASHFGVPVTGDRRSIPDALRRLLPGRQSSSGRAS